MPADPEPSSSAGGVDTSIPLTMEIIRKVRNATKRKNSPQYLSVGGMHFKYFEEDGKRGYTRIK
jgi:hypothetical protein